MPNSDDYKRLNLQRQSLDSSLEASEHALGEYYREYTLAQKESWDGDVATIHQSAVDRLDGERKSSERWLRDMEGSLAMKNDETRAAFDNYEQKTIALATYYDEMLGLYTNLAHAVAGVCVDVQNVDFGQRSVASDFVQRADECLAALKDAGDSTQDEAAKKMFSDLETVFRDQRDAFSKGVGKNGLEAQAAKMDGLSAMLAANPEVAKIQSEYQTKAKQKYDTKIAESRKASQELGRLLDGLSAKTVKSEGGWL